MQKPSIAASWWVIAASVALSILLVLGAIYILYIPRITTHDFPVYLVGLIVIVGGLYFGVARLRPRDVGLRRSTFLPGLAWTLVAWLTIQVIAGAADLLAFGHLTLNATWRVYSVVAVLGIFLFDQLLGNSLFEEIVWRGFLLPQLALKFERRMRRPAVRWTAAILVSQALFALYHIPIQIYDGEPLASLPFALGPIWIIGILLAVVYLLSGNLYLVIGLHALSDLPLLLFAVPAPLNQFISVLPLLGCVCALVVRWAWGKRRPGPQGMGVGQPAG